MTQEQLALGCNINTRYLGKLENGIHVPTLDVLIKLLPGLGVTLVEFAIHYEKHFRLTRKYGLGNKHPKPRFEVFARTKTRLRDSVVQALQGLDEQNGA